MDRRFAGLVILSLVISLSFSAIGTAQQNGRGLKFFKQQDPNLALKSEHGPYLIYAFSLEGPESKMQAVKLASELRSSFGLMAYIMPKTFDFSTSVVGSGLSEDGRMKVMRYADDRVVESYSILIGDFASADLPEVKETLQKVKTIQPNFFKSEVSAKTADEVTPGEKAQMFRSFLKLGKGDDDSATPPGPMHYAFIIRNPLLPEEWFDAPEMDEFITDLNKKAEFSILDCPGRFTVRVAHFTGVQDMVLGNNADSKSDSAKTTLDQAAAQAYMLAKLLRKADIEAYEYHERNASSVCVGSFEELGAMDANGEFVYSPAILDVVQKFGGTKSFQPSKYGPLPVVKTLLDVVDYKTYPELTVGSANEKLVKVKQYSIPFEQFPKPIFVPKPASNGLYKKSFLGRK